MLSGRHRRTNHEPPPLRTGCCGDLGGPEAKSFLAFSLLIQFLTVAARFRTLICILSEPTQPSSRPDTLGAFGLRRVSLNKSGSVVPDRDSEGRGVWGAAQTPCDERSFEKTCYEHILLHPVQQGRIDLYWQLRVHFLSTSSLLSCSNERLHRQY